MGRRRKRRRLKKKFRILFKVIGLLFILGAGAAFYVYLNIQDTVTGMNEELNREHSSKRDEPVDVDKQEPISILLLGVDERKGDVGRSDTMVVMTLNPKKDSMYMFNIQRDTRTEIAGKGIEDKINHAYAYGGVQMSVTTVEHFLDIPIDHYVKVNMEAFSDLVDALDGVTVNNKTAWAGYPEGEIELRTGEEALGYVRMRKKDPRGDVGRNERQRQVLQAIIDKGASASTVTNFNDVLNVLGDNVKTDMSLKEMDEIRKNYASARNNVKQFEVRGEGTKINGVYYELVSEEERLQVSARLKEHLEIGRNVGLVD